MLPYDRTHPEDLIARFLQKKDQREAGRSLASGTWGRRSDFSLNGSNMNQLEAYLRSEEATAALFGSQSCFAVAFAVMDIYEMGHDIRSMEEKSGVNPQTCGWITS